MKNINHALRQYRPAGIAGRFTSLASIGIALLLLASIRSGQAAEIKIVSPQAYQNREGEGWAENCCPPFRHQQVFPAADFAALGNRPHWVVRYTWRPDQSLTNPLTVQLPDQEVRLSTTQRHPNTLSLRFADNFGSDVTQFYRGRVIPVAEAQSPGPGPRPFYRTDFPAGVTPFLYDPRRGNLLFDVISWQGESPARADLAPIFTALYAEPAAATQGDRNWAAIFQFTFIPMPELSNPSWSGGQFQFTLTGETNVNYVIQASTNLQSWMPLATNTSPTVSRSITINAPSSQSFYRAVVGRY